MFIKQFYLEALGHASYLVGSEKTGEAMLFDVRRDVSQYFEAARRKGVSVQYACDSHGHNDYLSGLTEVRERAGLEVWGSAEADLGYDHRPLHDGDEIEMGEVGITVLHTPGHTPEHISLLLTDHDLGDEPAILLSGGALLVGDLARPDLLGGEDEATEHAKTFCSTLQNKILTLPDHVLVYPTHVAGSLCGGNIGSRLSTTVGYERLTNEILRNLDSSDDFVRQCLDLENLPAVPPYWKRMRNQNLDGVPSLGVLSEPPAQTVSEFEKRISDGAIVLDCRSPEAFAGGHIPGALNVAMGSSFPTWAGTVLPADRPVALVAENASDVWDATWHLLRIGYDQPVGWLADGMMAWRTKANDVRQLAQISVHELRDRLADRSIDLLDVRQPGEWAEAHVDGARFITGAELPSRLDAVPSSSRPVAVMCGSGFRSTVSASLLLHHGRTDVVNVIGGMSAWSSAGLPTTTG